MMPMNRYKCKKCKGNQYSSSNNKSNEACIYCGSKEVELAKHIDETKIFTEEVQELEN